MGRKGPEAITKTVLKSVSKMQQLGSMPNLKFQTFLTKNPPVIHCCYERKKLESKIHVKVI